MKKLYALIPILLTLPAVCQGADYWYARDDAGEYGAEDGTSYEAAFDGTADISWAGITCDDTLYICGEHHRSAANQFTINKVCTSDQSLTISFDCPGDPGSINGIFDFPAFDVEGTWTNHSGNIWYISTAGWGATTEIPRRVWLRGDEYPHTENEQSNADVSEIGTTFRWSHNATEQRVYLYSVGNPALNYDSIAGLQHVNYPIYVSEKSYIDIINPRIYGGRAASVLLLKSDNIRLVGSTDTAIVTQGGLAGIMLTGDTGVESSYCEITGINLDSGFEHYTDFAYDSMDGVNLKAAHHTVVHGNKFKNWTHNAVLSQTTDASLLVGNSYNDIYSNEIFAPDVSYSRAVTFDGLDPAGPGGYTQFNDFYLNDIHNIVTRSQINGNNNSYHHNLIRNMRNSPVVAFESAQVVHFQVYDTYTASQDNSVYSNTAFDIDGPFAYFTDDTSTRSGHDLYNNICVDCGLDTVLGTGTALYVPDQANISSISAYDNFFFNDGVEDVISYRGVAMTVAEFDAADENGDSLHDNQQTDPKLTTTGKLKESSPARGACPSITHYGSDCGAFTTQAGLLMPWNQALSISYNPGVIGPGRLRPTSYSGNYFLDGSTIFTDGTTYFVDGGL